MVFPNWAPQLRWIRSQAALVHPQWHQGYEVPERLQVVSAWFRHGLLLIYMDYISGLYMVSTSLMECILTYLHINMRYEYIYIYISYMVHIQISGIRGCQRWCSQQRCCDISLYSKAQWLLLTNSNLLGFAWCQKNWPWPTCVSCVSFAKKCVVFSTAKREKHLSGYRYNASSEPSWKFEFKVKKLNKRKPAERWYPNSNHTCSPLSRMLHV